MLLDAYPEALFQQDSSGWTPLHLTILHGGDEETILLLIRRGGKIVASVQSPYIGSPLHLACRHIAPLAVLEALVKANIEMVTAPNEYGTKPADLVWTQFLRQSRNKHVFNVVVRPDENRSDININHPSIKDLIERIKILLAAVSTAGRENQNQNEPLKIHDLVSNLPRLGDISPLLNIVVRLYPEQVRIMDQNGNYPLHLVARNPGIGQAPQLFSLGLPWSRDPMEIIVSSYPLAASVMDRNGNLPLHLALKTGQRKWGTELSSLVSAYSEALQLRDRETGLLPFQLAAVFPAKNDLDSLGTIFELLLACPHTVLLG